MRNALGMLASQLRELGRHGIIWLLTTGTAVATIYALSQGKLTLPSVLEQLLSIGGIAAGLELAIVYIGLHVQALDMRIKTAKRREVIAEYVAERRRCVRAFFGLLVISYVCGGIYRTQALHNTPLAWFEAAIPPCLIYIFTIILRRLPPDYSEMGRQAAMESMVNITRESGAVMKRYMRDIGRGRQLEDKDIQTVGMAMSFLSAYMAGNEQLALENAIQQSGGAQIVDADTRQWLTTTQIAEQYSIPPRTAQDWAAQIPGRKRAERGKRWLVPADALYQSRGVPGLSGGPYNARTRRGARDAQEGAGETQIVAMEAQ